MPRPKPERGRECRAQKRFKDRVTHSPDRADRRSRKNLPRCRQGTGSRNHRAQEKVAVLTHRGLADLGEDYNSTAPWLTGRLQPATPPFDQRKIFQGPGPRPSVHPAEFNLGNLRKQSADRPELPSRLSGRAFGNQK